jgi:hypothetical protein
MPRLGNQYDVSGTIDTTDPVPVNAEVDRIFSRLYPDASSTKIDRAFRDASALYRGEFPGFHACDTPYHDLQHVLAVTLAMARLMDGFEQSEDPGIRLDAALFQLGIVAALFHDCGYVRKLDDSVHKTGGELTLTHVSRGGQFLKDYLPTIGMGDAADVAAALIHFTGFEIPVWRIELPSLRHRLLGSLLGSADIIAQMSDRCYLEKCRDRLYDEFVAGGIARRQLADGTEETVFESGEDLVRKTPKFFVGASQRLETDLGSVHRYVGRHFGGQDLYFEALHKNIEFAEALRARNDTLDLKRNPPNTQDIEP